MSRSSPALRPTRIGSTSQLEAAPLLEHRNRLLSIDEHVLDMRNPDVIVSEVDRYSTNATRPSSY